MMNPAETKNIIYVAIVDDHRVVREGLRAFLELAGDIVIVGEADNGPAAVELAVRTSVDVMIIDLVMPGAYDGIEAIRQIHVSHPHLKLLALTSFQRDDAALDALAAGAIGYLHKDVQPDLLLAGIRQAASGRMVLEASVWAAAESARRNPEMRRTPLMDPTTKAQQPSEPLTGRELEVLRALATGLSNKEIGAKLGISEKTVKVHVSHILAKLNVYDRTQAVLIAARIGLVDIG